MSDMSVHWSVNRLDEEEDADPALSECLLEIEGRIEVAGEAAGLVDAAYLFTEEPESPAAFMEFWDLDGAVCGIFEEIIAPDHETFREPLPQLLEAAPGLLCVHYIALRPAYRGRGLGREVMRELVRHFADDRTGVVLLDARPLQHRPRGYDDFFDEVRDLPWNPPDEDFAKLAEQFRRWGMRRLARTNFMFAAPEALSDEMSPAWYPALLWDPQGE